MKLRNTRAREKKGNGMAKALKKTGKQMAAQTLKIEAEEGESNDQSYARVMLDPVIRHACNAMNYSAQVFGESGQPSIMESTQALQDNVAKAEAGDLKAASRMLASQAYSLDTMFTELARRSIMNMGEYIDASDRYMRLALKAQTACRATLEALAKLHQPREQIVKHVHVNEGGQAVVTDQIHHYKREGENRKSNDQCHATGTAGDGTAMLSHDAEGNGVSIPGGKRPDAVPDARGHKSRSA